MKLKRNILIFVFTVLLAIVIFVISDTVVSKKDDRPSVTIAHAVCDENGNLNGGESGDQTGSEVFTRNWYSGWEVVIRAKDSEKAETIAVAAEDACKNDHIGYDQYNRTSFYEKAKLKNWHISEITDNCETDCSALVAVCVNAAGIEISKDIYTGNLKTALSNTKQFDFYTDSSYTQSTELLQRGDILLKKGHVAIIIDVSSD